MVEFIDGSTIAQASPPNMKGPIAYALSYPDRISRATPAIDWTKQHSWDFAPIDSARFPAVALARYVGEIGGAAPAIFNAANECAVSAFLNQELKFASIVKVVSAVVDALASSAKSALRDLHDVNDIENDARRLATEQIREFA